MAVLLLGSGILGLFLTGTLPLRASVTNDDLIVLRNYEAISHALADEELDVARKTALSLVEIKSAKFSKLAADFAKSDSLVAAHANFVPLSKALVELAQGRDGFFVMHCAMDGCLEHCENCPMGKYSPWLQISREVENPYMGKAHIKCGLVSQN